MSVPAERIRRVINMCLGLGAVGLAATVAVYLVHTRPLPESNAAPPNLTHVEVLQLQPTLFEAPIVGYGTVRPKRQVKIVPQVAGQLVDVHPDLAVGNVIEKGELLFQIDPRTYQARIQQVEAEINRLEIMLKAHEQERSSLQERLELARQQAELAESALQREQDLLAKGSVTAPEVESAQERYLRHRDQVLAYESRLAAIPVEIEETNAMLATKRAMHDEARLNLEHTKIVCPFDARIDNVTAQDTQVVITGLQIATLTDMEALELSVAIDPRELRWTDVEAFASAVGKDTENAPEAQVTWTMLGTEYTWRGQITRLERLDENTRRAHVVVELKDVMGSLEIDTGRSRPPLSVGMFCRAVLPTAPLENALVIPRHALQNGKQVYVFQPDSKDQAQGYLAIREVPVLRNVGDSVLIAFQDQNDKIPAATQPAGQVCELAPGDRVIVTPIPRAVEGMRLALQEREIPVTAKATFPAGERFQAVFPAEKFAFPAETTLPMAMTGVR